MRIRNVNHDTEHAEIYINMSNYIKHHQIFGFPLHIPELSSLYKHSTSKVIVVVVSSSWRCGHCGCRRDMFGVMTSKWIAETLQMPTVLYIQSFSIFHIIILQTLYRKIVNTCQYDFALK